MNNAGAMNQMMAMTGSGDAMVEEQMRNVRIAMSKGKRFIRLLHRTAGAIPERVYPVDGYIVRTTHNSLTKTNESLVIDKEGAEVLFVPDPETGMRTAYILDTAFNRRFLATHLLENRWDIEDPTTNAEVNELAKTIPMVIDTSRMHESASMQTVVSKETVVNCMSDDQISKQIADKQKEIELLEKAKAKRAPASTQSETQGEGGEIKPEMLVSAKMIESVPPHILQRVTNAVTQRHGALLRNLQAQFGNQGISKSAEFKKKIQPQLDSELMKAMNEEQGQGSKELRNSNADDKRVATGTTV